MLISGGLFFPPHMCGQWREFWQLVLIEPGLYTALWSLVIASGFFKGRVVVPRGLGCDGRTCLQQAGSGQPTVSSPDPGPEQSEQLVPTQLSLQPACPPRPPDPPDPSKIKKRAMVSFRAFLCG